MKNFLQKKRIQISKRIQKAKENSDKMTAAGFAADHLDDAKLIENELRKDGYHLRENFSFFTGFLTLEIFWYDEKGRERK